MNDFKKSAKQIEKNTDGVRQQLITSHLKRKYVDNKELDKEPEVQEKKVENNINIIQDITLTRKVQSAATQNTNTAILNLDEDEDSLLSNNKFMSKSKVLRITDESEHFSLYLYDRRQNGL